MSSSLCDFFSSYRCKVDLFCLQEVFNNGVTNRKIYSEAKMDIADDIGSALINYSSHFAPTQSNDECLACFVSNKCEVKKEESVFVFRWLDALIPGDAKTLGRNIQSLQIESEGKSLAVINFHGLWNGQGKGDSEDRISQSQKIIDYLKTLNCEYVLCGDFNLLPDTRSLKMLEEFGLRNLISEYEITSTRTSFYKPNVRHANYVFVSSGIKVNNFEVLPEEVSDHNALLLDFEV